MQCEVSSNHGVNLRVIGVVVQTAWYSETLRANEPLGKSSGEVHRRRPSQKSAAAVAATAAVIAAMAVAVADAVQHNRWGSILVATCHAPQPPPPPPAPPPRPQPQKTHAVCQSVAYVRRRPVRLSCPSVCTHVSVAVVVRSSVCPSAPRPPAVQ